MSTSQRRGRGRPPIAHSIVEKLEEQGATPIADKVREVAGLPPRALSRDEDFIQSVRELVVMRPVGFFAGDEDEAKHWAVLVRELPGPDSNQRYLAKVDGARVEVKLVSVSE